MQDNPTATQLVEEVHSALSVGIDPGFPQKVAANALGIAVREMTKAPAYAAVEMDRLAGLVGDAGNLAERNNRLAKTIRSGDVSAQTPGLLTHLIRTTIEKIEIDQPSYPAFRQWQDAHRSALELGQ